MRNVIVGPAFPLRGGIANFNESLCRAFLKAGIDSEIVSFTLQYPSLLFPGKTQLDHTAAKPKGIAISSRINSINPFNWPRVASYIKSRKPDYAIFRYWLPFMGPCLGTIAGRLRKAGIPVIAITDNIIPHEARIGDEALTRYFVKRCDAFVAMSRSVLKELEQFTSTQHKRFIPHPIYDMFGEKVGKQVALAHLRLNPDDKHILFFGFIRRYKGLDLLLEAMADEAVKALGVKLIVAGEFYEDKSYYEDIIEKHQLQDRLILRTNYIPPDEVKFYFCAADMVAQTYRTATQSGITQVAYNFERPMLVTNVGGLAEIVPHEKAGYVCETNSSAIAKCIADYYARNREGVFAENIKAEKHRFEWSNMVHGIGELAEGIR